MKIENLTKRYRETLALDGVSLELETGKITAILGGSGAGKTTLLNAIAGLDKYEGSIEGAGRVSYLFQSAKLLPHLTAEGNLKFVLNKEDYGRVLPALARVGLAGKEKRYPHELSGGERQRVAIARAFLYPCDTLLMDEPFSSLDLSLKKSLISLVESLWRESGKTVVFVTHDVREAVLLASRAVVLRAGRTAADVALNYGYPRDFFLHVPEEDALVRALLGE